MGEWDGSQTADDVRADLRWLLDLHARDPEPEPVSYDQVVALLRLGSDSAQSAPAGQAHPEHAARAASAVPSSAHAALVRPGADREHDDRWAGVFPMSRFDIAVLFVMFGVYCGGVWIAAFYALWLLFG